MKPCGQPSPQKVFAILMGLTGVMGDGFQIAEDEEFFVLHAKTEKGGICQDGFALVKDHGAIMVHTEAPDVAIDVDDVTIDTNSARENNKQFGVFLAGKGLSWILPCSAGFFGSAGAATAFDGGTI